MGITAKFQSDEHKEKMNTTNIKCDESNRNSGRRLV